MPGTVVTTYPCSSALSTRCWLPMRATMSVAKPSHRQKKHNENTLYFATGMGLGMNGNYTAGILEGVIHYLPEMAQTIQA